MIDFRIVIAMAAVLDARRLLDDQLSAGTCHGGDA